MECLESSLHTYIAARHGTLSGPKHVGYQYRYCLVQCPCPGAPLLTAQALAARPPVPQVQATHLRPPTSSRSADPRIQRLPPPRMHPPPAAAFCEYLEEDCGGPASAKRPRESSDSEGTPMCTALGVYVDELETMSMGTDFGFGHIYPAVSQAPLCAPHPLEYSHEVPAAHPEPYYPVLTELRPAPARLHVWPDSYLGSIGAMPQDGDSSVQTHHEEAIDLSFHNPATFTWHSTG
jgi:hypothetical protein